MIGHETGIGMEGREIRIPLYHARLELPDLRRSWDTTILMETGAGQGLHDVVLGNDVLQSCVFILDGPAGKFTLRCPGYVAWPAITCATDCGLPGHTRVSRTVARKTPRV